MRFLDLESPTVQVDRQEKRSRAFASWDIGLSAKDFKCSMGPPPIADEHAWSAFCAEVDDEGQDSLDNIPRKTMPTFVKLATGDFDEGDR